MSDDPALKQYTARIGTVLRGKWRIDSLIGVGGMAAVYEATHRIGRRCAIKILHPEIAVSKEHRARFEQEALAVNQLGHPAAVNVLDIDTSEDGSPFLVMELLDGESLGKRAQRSGGIEERELLRIVSTVLEVLDVAHGLGIVHRDIKPDNLFLTSSGGVKVLDFGIARMKQGGSVRTRVGSMLGTIPYMSPEQIAGREIDGRADVFAVGATMFRILAKRHVHEGSMESELLIKMATLPAPALRTVAPSVSPEVCAIVDRALAFDLSRRYPTARAMREDIERVLGAKATPHAPVPVSIRADVSSAISVDGPTMAAPAPDEAMQAPMVTPAPDQAMQAPMATSGRPQSAATSAEAGSNSRFLMIAVIGSVVLVVCLAAVFFVVRSGDSAEDTRESADDDTSREDKASGTMAASSNTSTPSSTAGPSSTRRPAPNGKYRLLLKDGKYPFCVTSKLKNAYPVRTNDEGVKVCSGTPEGPIPVDGLKAYHPSEFQWE
ncbi:serine/threonine-protein kinase [Polyangium sp. 15x6]|uniref:serine/threonine protein kinase n=1 Tax=Polyangium sp. 15x6 TaxID=3042687 RepID=UPI00249B4BAD|nr:serine/threonine-protein kinase [Polyangium sp. 15x6]MDI3287423.1 protein kinase [Polyangium sp. 15x6]